MKNILIIGKGSYIGEAIFSWLKQYLDTYNTNITSPLNYAWKKIDYTKYDTVINLAGIAHIMNMTNDMKPLFYSVNRDLAIEIGKHAKQNGVRHFIHFSSMNVYGDFCRIVSDRSAESPTSFYGDSKLQGDIGLKKLDDHCFHVSIVRPPFVYGKNCKGNYNTIRNIAKKTPIFPTYKNKKSMIYIDNLCEFIRLLIEDGNGGIYTPQNKEIVSTSDLVRQIANVHGKKIWYTGIFNWTINLGIKLFTIIKKAFIDDSYILELSNYYDFKYCIVDFTTSIRRTET